jgi:hypothetical protein
MVEVAVSARQGDSGGPILNSRGELAGVLFGEGHGRTSGSYCGRVRWFLTSVVRPVPAATIAGTRPLEAIPSRPAGMTAAREVASTSPAALVASLPSGANSQPNGDQLASTPAAAALAPGGPNRSWPTEQPAAAPVPLVASTRAAAEPAVEVIQIGWHDIAGETYAEQAKTVLAGIGIMGMLLHLLRWLSREEAKA